MLDKNSVIGVVGAGAMGSGIAQVAASFGHKVFLFDSFPNAVEKSRSNLDLTLIKLVEKGKISDDDSEMIKSNIHYVDELANLSNCDLVIEAIIEDLNVKKDLFSKLSSICKPGCILASNTSSLSIASISSSVKDSSRMLGIHFFNPAPLMPLVEIIPCMDTDPKNVDYSKNIIDSWNKKTVIVKDTPGFIVNRIARPFYGEALRIYEEGIADFATIDQAMRDEGFKMGPFELMDYIGNDINYTVTETVFKEFYFEPRFRPSFTQKRMMESGRLGRKTGKGYYSYQAGVEAPQPSSDTTLKKQISNRIIVMLMNEAIDALYLKIASARDIETAMLKGVNYPKGLLAWAEEWGLNNVLEQLENLQSLYMEDRYRPSVLLKKVAKENQKLIQN